jgi:capsular exopolysaccharide synthesis family protein
MRLEHTEYPELPPPAAVELDEEAPRHLRDYLAVLRRHRRLVLLYFCGTLALAGLVTLIIPRRYTASTRLQLERQSPIQLRLQNNVLSLDDSDRGEHAALTFVGTQVTALRSRDLAERVIRSYGLAESPAFLEPARNRRGGLLVAREVHELFHPRGLEPAQRVPANASDARMPLDPEMLDRYMRWLSVKQVQGTDLVDVTFVTPSPTLSAFLAAAHAQAYIESNQDVRHSTDVLAQGFLTQKLATARKRVKAAEAALERFAGQHPAVAVEKEQRVGGQQIVELSSLLTKAEATRVGLESRFAFLSSPRADPLAYFLEQPGVAKLRLALLDVRAQRAGIDARLGDNHPRMIELRRLENEIANQLRTEVSHGVASVRAHYDAAKQREDQLRGKLEQLQRVGSQQNRLIARYELLRNDVEAARNLHTSLLEQKMATAANSDLGASNVRLIERAEVPVYPTRPNIPLNLVLGMAAGLVIGIGAAFARDYFDETVRNSAEVEILLQTPSLGTIPNFGVARHALPPADIKNGNGAGPEHDGPPVLPASPELVVLHEPASPMAEAFRNMRTALLLSRSKAPRVVVITSARAAEGKTVASLNLATALAQAGSRTVLVEADLRHPRCHRMLGLHDLPGRTPPGLTAFLAGERDDLESLIQPLEPPGLFFLPCGALLPNPADLIASPRMRDVLHLLRNRYDFVIVDTPPALPVTDAVLVARHADGVVLVVRGNDTPRELVRRLHERLAQTHAHFLGVIVNNVDGGWGDPYFYDSYYGYRGAEAEERAQAEAHGLVAWLRRQHGLAPVAASWRRAAGRFARGGPAA